MESEEDIVGFVGTKVIAQFTMQEEPRRTTIEGTFCMISGPIFCSSEQF
jgi:hypothetical protein